MANTFKFGNGNWAVKDGYALAYNDENNNFKPLPFDFTRASSATRVNKQGLVEVVPSGKPRIDFLDNTSGHLLLEPSRTNLIPHSEDFDVNTTWLSSGRPSIDADAIVSPEGIQNGTKLTYSSGNTLRLNNQFTFTNGYSYSIFVKKDVGRYVTIYAAFFTTSAIIGFDLDEGTCQSGGIIEDYGDGWYRISVSKDVSGDADRSGYFYLYSTDSLGSTTSASGNKLYVYGAQLEEGTYPTSYIPTEGSSVTRVAEFANDAGNSQVFNNDTGVWFIDLERIGLEGGRAMMLANASGSEQIRIHFDTTAQIRFRDGKASFATIGGNISMGVGTRKKGRFKNRRHNP